MAGHSITSCIFRAYSCASVNDTGYVYVSVQVRRSYFTYIREFEQSIFRFFLRLIQLAYIWQPDPLRMVKWEPVQDESQLIALTNTTWLNVAWIPGYYLLVGTELMFPCKIANAKFRMFYQYDPWPTTPTSASWLDDLGQFSDLIALLAAKVYMSRDGTINKALTQNIMDRKSQLFEFLATGRDASGPNRVSILP